MATERPRRAHSVNYFSPDGRTLATGAEDGTISLWHAEAGEKFYQLAKTPASIVKMAFSPSQDLLLGLLRSGEIVLFEGAEEARASRQIDAAQN